MTVIRLAQSAETLSLPAEELATLRDAIVRGAAPVIHPMTDEVLDPAVEAIDWTRIVEEATCAVVSALQAMVQTRSA